MNNTEWHLLKPDETAAGMLAGQLGVSITIARLLTGRGITSPEPARKFLYGDLADLTDPWLMSGMEAAVRRIEQAITAAEPIVIYGDYDADGVCSTVLMTQCLRRLGACVEYYIPDRFAEGYGLNMQAIEKLAGQGYQLMITVDNGISSYAETKRGRELGLDIIITDHHTPPPDIPPATAIINPKLDNLSESAELAGTGVVFQLCRALGQDRLSSEEIWAWLDLVALATVADAVPLKGDNRILVRHGLQRMGSSTNPGLSALLKASSLEGQELAAWHLAFVLGPRINAAGRLKNASLVAELFLSENVEHVVQRANELTELNSRRRAIEEAVTQDAIGCIESQANLDEEQVLVVGGDGWHQGVIGIVASRLAERYNRPAVVISWDEEQGKGSCRSLPGFNIYEALAANSSWLEHFGGHKLAAGLSINRQNYDRFRAAINKWAVEQGYTGAYCRQQMIDLELTREEITMDLARELKKLEPFGEDNPAPRFIMRGVGMESYQLMGKQQEHFRCRAAGLDAVAFGRADFMSSSLAYLNQDLVFSLEENEFRGKKSIQLRLKDIKPACSTLAFYSRNPGAAWLNSMLTLLQGQLEMGRHVIIAYPTCRLLNKQKLMFKRFFPPGVIEELHGCLAYGARMRAERRLHEDNIKVCLTTRAYLQYYMRKQTLSPSHYHIIEVWTATKSDGWPQELESCQHTVWHWRPGHRIKVDRDWSIKNKHRTFIYSNRPTTLRNLAQEMPGIYIEVGVDNPEKRDAIRQGFLAGEKGTLLSDGAYAGMFNAKAIEEMVFADLPFSEYEALAVLNQIAADQDTQIRAAYGPDAVDFNRNHLERSYPGETLIRAVWKWLCSHKQTPVKTSIEDIITGLRQGQVGVITALETEAALCILADLGLCEIEKKGSIMAIKLTDTGAAEFDLSESPYYLEGLAEKKAFAAWLELLNEIYAW